MKRLLLLLVLLLLAAVAAGAGYVFLFTPAQRAVTGLKIEATPERLTRGEYLVNNVVVCFGCHTKTDPAKRTLPKVGPDGAGGECFTEEMGFPGHVCAPNITSDPEAGIGAWTDDEVLRAIREGVDRDGQTLFPMMPYGAYRNLPDEDAYAVVAYIRSLPADPTPSDPPTVNFPVNLLVRMAPQPVTTVAEPNHSDLIAYGGHMATVAGCRECHTADLSGGDEFRTPAGIVRSSNLTPGAKGIVPEELDDFLRIFRAYKDGQMPEGLTDRDFTVMPWVTYSGMAEDDLRAIHAYLRSIPPVEKQVQTYGETKSD